MYNTMSYSSAFCMLTVLFFSRSILLPTMHTTMLSPSIFRSSLIQLRACVIDAYERNEKLVYMNLFEFSTTTTVHDRPHAHCKVHVPHSHSYKQNYKQLCLLCSLEMLLSDRVCTRVQRWTALIEVWQALTPLQSSR